MYTHVEENYLKAIYLKSQKKQIETVKTSELSEALKHKPSTTTETLDRLYKKGLIWYQKYKGVELSPLGEEVALRVIRRHRLWKSFLMDKLGFSWDEVSDIAEQLEHVSSPLLIDRLDQFLDRPQKDPHGIPIPDRNGKMAYVPYRPLTMAEPKQEVVIRAVSCDERSFLQQLDRMNIYIGQSFVIDDIDPQERIITLTSGHLDRKLSQEIAKDILVSI